VEEGELGEAAGRAKLLFRPLLPILQAERFPSFGKIELAKEPGNPDIDGEGVPAGVGVKQHAPRDLGTDAGEFLQMLRGPFRGPGFRYVQQFRLVGEDLGGGGEVFGTVTELALAEPLFARSGESLGRGKVAGRTAEGAAEAFVDLANLDDLLQRGADKVGEALPWVLAQGAEAGMGFAGLGEPRIPGMAQSQERVEFQIEAEVVMEGGGGEKRIVPDQLALTDRQGDGMAANPAGELAGDGLVPAKGLASQKRGGQIERNGELQGGHGGEKLKGG